MFDIARVAYRRQDAMASGPIITDVFGMVVIRISVIAVVVGVVVAVNTGSITAFDSALVINWKR